MWDFFLLLQFFFLVTNAGSCQPPPFPGGHVTGQRSDNSWVGTFSCRAGASLVGEARLKCRDGVWSSQFPVCTAIGKCDPSLLPGIENGQRQAVREFRRSVFRFVCNRGFDLVGEDVVFCDVGGWSLDRAPLCIKLGCDEEPVSSLEHGVATRLHGGAVYQYSCSSDTVLRGSPMLTCDGERWNDSRPICLTGPTSISLTGPSTLSVDRDEVYRCTTSPSKTTSTVKWKVTDNQGVDVPDVIKNSNSSLTRIDLNFMTTAYATLSLSSPLPMMTVQCTTTGDNKVQDTMAVMTHYAPENISVTAPDTVHTGDSVTVTCSTSPSMPATSMHWVVEQGDMSEKEEPEPEVFQMPGGGLVTRSTLTVMAGDNDPILVECYADHPELGEQTLAYAHEVSVISPPGLPSIQGLDLATPVILGSQLSLHCSARAGNPPASLVWYRGSQVMESTSELLGHTVTAYVTFLADDGPIIELTCEAFSEPLKGSLKKTINVKTITPTTTTTPPVTPSPSRASSPTSPRQALVAARRSQKLHDRPVADMPVEDDMYDYSHFSYLNDRFEETYKETLAYAEQYYEEEYEYVEYGKIQNKEMVDNDNNEDYINKAKSEEEGGMTLLNTSRSPIQSSTLLVTVMVVARVWVWQGCCNMESWSGAIS